MKGLLERLEDRVNSIIIQAEKIDDNWRRSIKAYQNKYIDATILLTRVRNSANGLQYDLYEDIKAYLND